MRNKSQMGDEMGSGAKTGVNVTTQVFIRGEWELVARDGKTGKLKWADGFTNLVVNNGLDGALGSNLAGWTQVTSWYLGVTSGTPTIAAGDQMDGHAGWVEYTDIVETSRPHWLNAAVSGQSVSNTASKARFTMNDDATVGGAFMSSVNSIGEAIGSLYAVGSFAAKVLSSGDTLDVTATFTAAAS